MPQVDYMVLADAVTAVENKHYILGAGWDTLFAVRFPVMHPNLSIGCRLIVDWNETNEQCTLEIDVLDDDGVSVLPVPPGPAKGSLTVGRPPHITPGSKQSICLAFNLSGIRFDRAGAYSAILRVNGADQHTTTFSVMLLPGIQQPPSPPS